jgi:hypothetical protein
MSSQPSLFGKRCSTCGAWKPLEEFHRKSAAKDGRQSRCKACNIAGQIRVHAENPDLCRARIKARADRLKLENRIRVLVHLLTHPCVDCGEDDPVVLEFDHLGEKVANVSAMANRPIAWSVIAEEIAKCEVVCANCHRRRTCERANGLRAIYMREFRARTAMAHR